MDFLTGGHEVILVIASIGAIWINYRNLIQLRIYILSTLCCLLYTWVMLTFRTGTSILSV